MDDIKIKRQFWDLPRRSCESPLKFIRKDVIKHGIDNGFSGAPEECFVGTTLLVEVGESHYYIEILNIKEGIVTLSLKKGLFAHKELHNLALGTHLKQLTEENDIGYLIYINSIAEVQLEDGTMKTAAYIFVFDNLTQS